MRHRSGERTVALVIAAAILGAACSNGDSNTAQDAGRAGSPTAAASAASSPTPIQDQASPVQPAEALDELVVADKIGSLKGEGELASGLGDLWFSSIDKNALIRIDPKTKKVLATVQFPRDTVPMKAAFGEGAVWVAGNGTYKVFRIDPHSMQITDRLQLEEQPAGIAVGGGSIWVSLNEYATDQAANGVARVDPVTMKVTKTIPLNGPTHIEFFDGHLYVVADNDDTVYRMNPQGETTDQVHIVGDLWMTVGEGSLWVIGGLDAPIVEVDLETFEPVRSITASIDGFFGIEAAEGALWISSEYQVEQIEVASGNGIAVANIGLESEEALWDIEVAFGSVWVVDTFDGLLRIEP